MSSLGDNAPPFQAPQREFAAYIRDPRHTALPAGIEERRMAIYARLFYNNIESFLASTFQVFHKLIGDERWHALVRDFMRQHRAESPYFSHVPEEFLEYLGTPARRGPEVPAFALELCHYEWVELALDLAPDAGVVFDDDPIAVGDMLALSPLAWPLQYAFPVQRIGPDCQPTAVADEPTCLIGYRDRHDRVRFMVSNAATTRLLQLLVEDGDSRRCLSKIAAELGGALAGIEQFGLTILNRLHRHDIVVRA